MLIVLQKQDIQKTANVNTMHVCTFVNAFAGPLPMLTRDNRAWKQVNWQWPVKTT